LNRTNADELAFRPTYKPGITHRVGRGRPRLDGMPKISDVPLLPAPQNHFPIHNVATAGRFSDVICTEEFRREVANWDTHASAEKMSRRFGVKRATIRRYAQMLDPWYRQRAAQNAAANNQEHPQRLLEATMQPSQVAENEEGYDDPFGLGVSLGWTRDEDGGSDNPNPFKFSRADGRPMNPFPSSPLAKCGDHIHLHADRCLVICDLHCPAHDSGLLFSACKMAQKNGIKSVILGGDFLDMSSLSSYTQTGDRRRLMDDVELLRKILDIMRSQFSLEPVCILGNHEQRWNRIMGPDVSADEFLRLAFADVQVSRYEWCNLTSGGQEWHVDHGTGGSNPVLHGNRLAARLHKNIVLGHHHKIHETRDYSGRYQILASGACCDPRRVRYVSERIQASAWVQGVTVIQDGFGRVLGPQSPELQDA
jgi:hypothetical protein